ncbi:monocarboxylate transporter 12-B-like [Myripristis murdjan]|uniref:monocarboxylate transporter 12-B-like n=1 Tax=Myripristis murdjan TaxID=586833 RepID=UPI0011761059|nr:monocarboxylate transporter 12-B-like [Myripristis murdjan]
MAVTVEQKGSGGKGASRVVTAPDGGWGWMIVAGCFLTTICTRAVTRCISIFFVEFQLHFERDYSTTAWIHSLVDCTTMLCAPLGSLIGNRLSCRATVILGGLLSSTGLVLSSFTSSLECLYIFLGILTGLGFALSYTPAIAMVGKYFNERKALAYGIAMSGTGIGTFILAPAVQLLIEYYSWRGALLILGGFVSNLCVCGALMRPLEPRGGERKMMDKIGNLEEGGYVAALLDSKDEKLAVESSQAEPKQLDAYDSGDMELHVANGKLRNYKLENSKLAQVNLAQMLLSKSKLSDTRLTDVKLADSIVISNNMLTTKMLAEIKLSDPKLADGGTLEDLKLVESMTSNYKLADITATKLSSTVDTNIADVMDVTQEELRRTEVQLVDVQQLPVDTNTHQNTLMNTKTPSKCTCPVSTEEFGFLLMADFLLLAMSFLFLAYGCSIPVVYLIPYALSVGVEHQKAALLISIFGVSGIVGNITFGWITDRKCLKRYRTLSYMAAVGMEGLCCMFLPLLHSFPPLARFSMLYGYFDGAYVALIPVVTSDVVGSSYLTSALGVVHFLHAIPYLISPPIGGWLVDRTGDYTAAFLLSGFSLMISPLLLGCGMLLRHCLRSKTNSDNVSDSKLKILKNQATDAS